MTQPPLTEARIPDRSFAEMRRLNLARWPTGAEVDLDEAVAYLQSLPEHKNLAWVTRRALEQGRCLTQPRGGFGTFEMHKSLLETLDRQGLADVVPTTTDSYTRNERFAEAQRGADKLKAGDGDAAVGTMRALQAGLLDVPWSPNRECKSALMPARDADGYLRLVDMGALPLPAEIRSYHRECLQRTAKATGKAYGPDLASDSV